MVGPISESLLQLEAFKGAAGAYGFRNYVSEVFEPGLTTRVYSSCSPA